jgi:uncharacterized membrane protein (UPF0127 family)
MPRATVLGFDVPVAVSRRARLLGLSFLEPAEAGEGLLIRRCGSVHTFGMRFPLDLVFLDSDHRVIEVRRGVGANRLVRCRRAASVLELPTEA